MKKRVKNFFRYRFLLEELVKKGIKLKYRRSYLGILWSLVEPLLTMIVLTVIFGTLFGNNEKTFAVYVLSGRLLYSFFSQSTTATLRSIRGNSAMIKKVYVPKYLYPLSSVLFNYVIFLLSLVVLAVVSLVLGVFPNVYTLQIFIPLILILVFSFGVGMILATIGVFFRDMEYLWSVILMLVMYTCAIFYYPDKLLNSGKGWLLELNPLYGIISCFRDALFGEMMNPKTLLYVTVSSIIVSVIGIWIFYKKQDEFILHI
ncbi:MAG: ABC transporter permease [Lachnospiraceae bacterium]|nr:ABC transporter permease [Lachnospiraceae bacterium]